MLKIEKMNKKYTVWFLLCICCGLLIWNIYLREEINEQSLWNIETSEKIELLESQLKTINGFQGELTENNRQLQNQLEAALELLKSTPKLNKGMLDKLKKAGVEDVEILLKDLFEHQELIPYGGVLGGTMNFSSGWVLSDKYVMAEFEDGHVLGTMLLEYTLINGEVSWEVLASSLED